MRRIIILCTCMLISRSNLMVSNNANLQKSYCGDSVIQTREWGLALLFYSFCCPLMVKNVIHILGVFKNSVLIVLESWSATLIIIIVVAYYGRIDKTCMLCMVWRELHHCLLCCFFRNPKDAPWVWKQTHHEDVFVSVCQLLLFVFLCGILQREICGVSKFLHIHV